MMESGTENSDHKNNDLIITIPINQNSTTADSMGPSSHHQFEEFKDEDNSTKALHMIHQDFIIEEDETQEDPHVPKETPKAE